MTPDRRLLVSESTSVIPEGQEWPGSVVRWCSICGDSIWLSREAVAKLENEPDMVPVCAACAVPIMQEHARVEPVKVRKVDPRGAPLRPVLDYIKEQYGK